MATTPVPTRPREPAKSVSQAANPQERAKLEREWAYFRYQMGRYEQDDAARKRAELAQQQRTAREKKGADEMRAWNERAKAKQQPPPPAPGAGDQSGMRRLGRGAFG